MVFFPQTFLREYAQFLLSSWELCLIGVDAEEPLNLLFFVPAVTTRIDTDSGEFTSFAPTFEGEGRDTEELGNFTDS